MSRLAEPDNPHSEVITKPNTASCQFYICLDDQPQLDDKDTIFGRVLAGRQVLVKLQEGSVIVEAKVVRKRDKKYPVEKIPTG